MDEELYNLEQPIEPLDDDFIYPDDEQMCYQYAEQLLGEEVNEYSQDYNIIQQRNQVDEILQIFLTRRQDVLELIERYNVPRRISRALTRRIIQYVLNNAAQIPGNINQKTQELFRRFIASDNTVVPILRIFGVPFNVINQYIREVIRVTLRNIAIIPPVPPPQPNIDILVARILREFEQQYPNFLGLTSIYNIPVAIARDIVRDIIRFTILNLNRIPSVGTIDQRATAMLRLLDSQNPELIRVMIRRGVPAGQAEAIARQIIIFTLRRVPLPR